jgi:tetratricopeptide (TPR) repeat protein
MTDSSPDIRRLRLVFPISIISFALLFTAGCASRQQAVELYVDAVMLRELNENDNAVTKLNLAVKADKHFSLAHSLLGEIYEQMQDYPKATVSYVAAARLNPWSFKDYFSLGRVYQTMKEFAPAVNAYRRAAELKPDNLQANLNAAKCLYEVNDYNEALVYGKRAEQIYPHVGELQQLLGRLYDSQKNYEQATLSYKRALEINGNDPAVMMSLAIACLRTNRNEQAKELLTTITQLQPDNSSARQYLGYCFLRLEDLNQAIVNYRKAIKINSDDWEAYRGLGVAFMLVAIKDDDAGLKTQAVESWRQALTIKPDQPKRERLVNLIEKYSK